MRPIPVEVELRLRLIEESIRWQAKNGMPAHPDDADALRDLIEKAAAAEEWTTQEPTKDGLYECRRIEIMRVNQGRHSLMRGGTNEWRPYKKGSR